MAVYEESEDEPDEDAPQKSTKLPDLKEGEVCHTVKVDPQSHFTEPPARYTEASLIKFFEEKGIARPLDVYAHHHHHYCTWLCGT